QTRTLEGGFVYFVAFVDVCHIAFLGELDSLLVGKFAEAPVKHAQAVGLPVMEAVGAAFLARVLDIEVSLSAQGLGHLVDKSFCFTDAFLVGGKGLGLGGRGRGCLSPSHRQQEKNWKEPFHWYRQ